MHQCKIALWLRTASTEVSTCLATSAWALLARVPSLTPQSCSNNSQSSHRLTKKQWLILSSLLQSLHVELLIPSKLSKSSQQTATHLQWEANMARLKSTELKAMMIGFIRPVSWLSGWEWKPKSFTEKLQQMTTTKNLSLVPLAMVLKSEAERINRAKHAKDTARFLWLTSMDCLASSNKS